jgi:hypothetical protein
LTQGDNRAFAQLCASHLPEAGILTGAGILSAMGIFHYLTFFLSAVID